MARSIQIDRARYASGVPLSDTSPEAAEILRQRTLRLTPSQRIEEGIELCKVARQMMRAGIRMRHAGGAVTDELGQTLREIIARLDAVTPDP